MPTSRVMASRPMSNSFVTFQRLPLFVFCVRQGDLIFYMRNGTATGTTLHTIHDDCEWSMVCWFYHAIRGDWMSSWMTPKLRIARRELNAICMAWWLVSGGQHWRLLTRHLTYWWVSLALIYFFFFWKQFCCSWRCCYGYDFTIVPTIVFCVVLNVLQSDALSFNTNEKHFIISRPYIVRLKRVQ